MNSELNYMTFDKNFLSLLVYIID